MAIPSLGNSFVDLIKGSSIAFTVGVGELMSAANLSGIASYNYLEAFLAAAIIYRVLTIVVGRLQKLLETYLNRAY